jgi:DNA repair exonuclease SbcCD nuclease subunit
MNCLLLGRYIDFNSEENSAKAKTSQLKSKNQNLRLVVNHSVDLDTQEVTGRFSESLRALIQECLFRESLLRPKSTELVSRTREGLAMALRVVRVLDPRSSPLNEVPFTSLEPDEPPMAWEIPEFVVVETDYEITEAVDNTMDASMSDTDDWNVVDALVDILTFRT